MRISTYLLLTALLLPSVSNGFEYEGYKSGMTRSEVEKIASETATISNTKGTLIARFRDETYLTFNFCDELLVSMQQGQPPTLRQLSMVIEEFTSTHGSPILVTSSSRASPKGQIREFGMWWAVAGEYVSVYYMGVGEESELLSTSRQVQNSCFRVPR